MKIYTAIFISLSIYVYEGVWAWNHEFLPTAPQEGFKQLGGQRRSYVKVKSLKRGGQAEEVLPLFHVESDQQATPSRVS